MAQYIYGKNAVLARLKAGNPITNLYVLKNNLALERLVKTYSIKYQLVDKAFLNNLVAGVHQGLIAEIEQFQTYSLEAVLKELTNQPWPTIVMLDSLTDPHNLGAILRSADATGVAAVIISKNRSVSVTSSVAKVAAGALETVKVIEVVNLVQAIKTLKQAGFWIIGTAVDEAQDYRAVDYRLPVVLIIGSEEKGISRLVKENCDYLIKIPMLGKLSSLNAAVASGILLYEISNQRYPLKER